MTSTVDVETFMLPSLSPFRLSLSFKGSWKGREMVSKSPSQAPPVSRVLEVGVGVGQATRARGDRTDKTRQDKVELSMMAADSALPLPSSVA